MKTDRVRIGITGVGGGVGQSILKALYDSDFDLLGMDSEYLATGLYAAQQARLIPYASAPNYLSTLLEICKTDNIQVLFPGLDAELQIFSAHTLDFKEIGTTVVVSKPDVIRACDDKLLTYQILTQNGLACPLTMELNILLSAPDQLLYPIIVKQRKGGARSANVFRIDSAADLNRLVSSSTFRTTDYIAQEYLSGPEFTCGTVNLDGRCMGCIVMKRILRDGDTYKAFVVKDQTIEEAVLRAVNTLKPFGACNVQLRVVNDVPYIFEINARCSGTTAARALCGFNEPAAITEYLVSGKEPRFDIRELSVLRYWQELPVENSRIDELSNARRITQTRKIRL